mmetsp:Transcript_18437/g.52111  ORF Transcript_18437/g.52111 Transcript_18437/m.52111 type:complete len:386 (+) Transcript_18437:61-1218(+)
MVRRPRDQPAALPLQAAGQPATCRLPAVNTRRQLDAVVTMQEWSQDAATDPTATSSWDIRSWLSWMFTTITAPSLCPLTKASELPCRKLIVRHSDSSRTRQVLLVDPSVWTRSTSIGLASWPPSGSSAMASWPLPLPSLVSTMAMQCGLLSSDVSLFGTLPTKNQTSSEEPWPSWATLTAASHRPPPETATSPPLSHTSVWLTTWAQATLRRQQNTLPPHTRPNSVTGASAVELTRVGSRASGATPRGPLSMLSFSGSSPSCMWPLGQIMMRLGTRWEPNCPWPNTSRNTATVPVCGLTAMDLTADCTRCCVSFIFTAIRLALTLKTPTEVSVKKHTLSFSASAKAAPRTFSSSTTPTATVGLSVTSSISCRMAGLPESTDCSWT